MPSVWDDVTVPGEAPAASGSENVWDQVQIPGQTGEVAPPQIEAPAAPSVWDHVVVPGQPEQMPPEEQQLQETLARHRSEQPPPYAPSFTDEVPGPPGGMVYPPDPVAAAESQIEDTKPRFEPPPQPDWTERTLQAFQEEGVGGAAREVGGALNRAGINTDLPERVANFDFGSSPMPLLQTSGMGTYAPWGGGMAPREERSLGEIASQWKLPDHIHPTYQKGYALLYKTGYNTAAGLYNFLNTPEGMATTIATGGLGAGGHVGKEVAKLVTLGFTSQAVKGAIDQAVRGDWQGMLESLGIAGLTGAAVHEMGKTPAGEPRTSAKALEHISPDDFQTGPKGFTVREPPVGPFSTEGGFVTHDPGVLPPQYVAPTAPKPAPEPKPAVPLQLGRGEAASRAFVERLEFHAADARTRLRQQLVHLQGPLLVPNPAILHDAAIVVAAKIARGVKTSAQASKALVKELGEAGRKLVPHMKEIWHRAVTMHGAAIRARDTAARAGHDIAKSDHKRLLADTRTDPKGSLVTNARRFRANVPKPRQATNNRQQVLNAIAFFKGNLVKAARAALKEPWAKQAAKQYEGYNIYSHDLAERYGYKPEAVMVAESAQSPNASPDNSFEATRRLMKMLNEDTDHVFDEKMENWARNKVGYNSKQELVHLYEPHEVDYLVGKKFSDLPKGDYSQAQWMRAYDEAHHSADRLLRVVRPDGTLGATVKTATGKDQPFAWTTFSPIQNAIDALQGNAKPEEILSTPKVANYYMSKLLAFERSDHVVADTHHTSAAWGNSLPSSHPLVKDVFSAGRSKKDGTFSGYYSIVHEATLQAAKEVGMDPKEFQALVWSYQRGLKSPDSLGPTIAEGIQNLWKGANEGNVTERQAYEATEQVAREFHGEVPAPDYFGEKPSSEGAPPPGTSGKPAELPSRSGVPGSAIRGGGIPGAEGVAGESAAAGVSTPERITSAAIKFPDGRIETAPSHDQIGGWDDLKGVAYDGFATNKRPFVSADESLEVALKAKQISPELAKELKEGFGLTSQDIPELAAAAGQELNKRARELAPGGASVSSEPRKAKFYIGDVDEFGGDVRSERWDRETGNTHVDYGFNNSRWRYNSASNAVTWWEKPTEAQKAGVEANLAKKGIENPAHYDLGDVGDRAAFAGVSKEAVAAEPQAPRIASEKIGTEQAELQREDPSVPQESPPPLRNFLDAAGDRAAERLHKALFGLGVVPDNSLILADAATVGAAIVGRGIRNDAAWARAFIHEFGPDAEKLKPFIREIYARSITQHDEQLQDYQRATSEIVTRGEAQEPRSKYAPPPPAKELVKIDGIRALKRMFGAAEKAGAAGFKRGQKEGFKEAEMLGRTAIKSMQESLRTSEKWLDGKADVVEKELRSFANHLPLKERAKFIPQILAATRKPSLFAMKRDPMIMRNRAEKVLNNIAAAVYDYKKKDIIEKTTRSLNRIRNSKTITVPERLAIQNLERQFHRFKDGMSLDMLQRHRARIAGYEERGRDLFRLDEATQKLKTEIAVREITQQGVHKYDKMEQIRADLGQDLSTQAKVVNWMRRIPAASNYFNSAWTPMDWIFTRFDGREHGALYSNLKLPIDDATSTAMDIAYGFKKRLGDVADRNKLDDKNFERIAVYAEARQDGGVENLKASGYTDSEILSAQTLTRPELEYYREARKVFEEWFPHVQDVMAKKFHQIIKPEVNYWPRVRDWNQYDTLSIEDGRFADYYRRTSSAPGALIERKPDAISKNLYDAHETSMNHIDDMVYHAIVGPELKRVADLVRSDEFAGLVGKLGRSQFADWVDVLARNGGVGSKQLPWLDMVRKNVGVLGLGFRLTTMALQPLALIQAMPYVTMRSISSSIRSMVSKASRDWVLKNFPEIRETVGDDPAYAGYKGRKLADVVGQAAFKPLTWMDGLARISVAEAAYRDALAKRGLPFDRNVVDRPSMLEAQRVVRITQATSFPKDAPLALSHGNFTKNVSVDRALGQFSNYVIHRWAMLKHGAFQMGIKDKDPKVGAKIFAYLTLATVAEQLGREGIANVVRTTTGESQEQQRRRKKEAKEKSLPRRILERSAIDMASTVPMLGNVMSMVRYNSSGIAVHDTLMKTVTEATNIFRAKTPIRRAVGAIRTAQLVGGTAFGLPTGQVGELAVRWLQNYERTHKPIKLAPSASATGRERQTIERPMARPALR